jgi:hypothetical protein
MEKLPLRSLIRRRSLVQRAHSSKLVAFQLLQFMDANLPHAATIAICKLLNVIQVHLVK